TTRRSFFQWCATPRHRHSFPTRRSSDLVPAQQMFLSSATLLEFERAASLSARRAKDLAAAWREWLDGQLVPAFEDRILPVDAARSEEHTSELQSRENLVCRLLLEKNNQR